MGLALAAQITNPLVVNGGMLEGTSATFGGSLLTVGTSTSGTANIIGAIVGKPCSVSPADGVKTPGTVLDCYVTAPGVVTVYLTALLALTPPAKAYNVSVDNR